MRVLKKMGAPSGGSAGSGAGGGGPDLLDALTEMLDKSNEKTNTALDKKLENLKEEIEKNKAGDFQAQIDDVKLLQNAHQKHIMNIQLDFDVLKKNKTNQADFEEKTVEIIGMIEALEKKVDVIPKITDGDIERWNETIAN